MVDRLPSAQRPGVAACVGPRLFGPRSARRSRPWTRRATPSRSVHQKGAAGAAPGLGSSPIPLPKPSRIAPNPAVSPPPRDGRKPARTPEKLGDCASSPRRFASRRSLVRSRLAPLVELTANARVLARRCGPGDGCAASESATAARRGPAEGRYETCPLDRIGVPGAGSGECRPVLHREQSARLGRRCGERRLSSEAAVCQRVTRTFAWSSERSC